MLPHGILQRLWITILTAGSFLHGVQGAMGDDRPTSAFLQGIWEGTFTADREVPADTAFTLEMILPSGRKQTVRGFWDGGNVWKARYRPEEPGRFQFTTKSQPNIKGLDGIAGTVNVVPHPQANRFRIHGSLRVAASKTNLEHADGTAFFFLADTVWTGPALSNDTDWRYYLKDRADKKFTAIQFNAISPWRTAPTDAEGKISYTIKNDHLIPNPDYFRRLDARMNAIQEAGLLAVPVLAWAHKKGDAGFDLTEKQIITLIRYEMARYDSHHALFILAGDNRYTPAEAEKWKRIGKAVFADYPGRLVTTHPTGMNFPWADWESESWLSVYGYQSGHGDSGNTLKWIHSGPAAKFGQRKTPTRPIINLEPPYEAHLAYESRKPHSAYSVRRAVYWSLLATPVAGFTYGGHGVWSWHTKPGEAPTDHGGTGVAKPWKEALSLPGATETGHVRTLFESLPWTELRPAQEHVVQAKEKADPATFIACAAAEKSNTYVYYFPAGAKGSLGVNIRGDQDRVRWFNPRTGTWGRPENGRPARGFLEPPDDQDWIVVVRP